MQNAVPSGQGAMLAIIGMTVDEIESELSGKVEKFLITDNSPVEYDQDLIVISPD